MVIDGGDGGDADYDGSVEEAGDSDEREFVLYALLSVHRCDESVFIAMP